MLNIKKAAEAAFLLDYITFNCGYLSHPLINKDVAMVIRASITSMDAGVELPWKDSQRFACLPSNSYQEHSLLLS